MSDVSRRSRAIAKLLLRRLLAIELISDVTTPKLPALERDEVLLRGYFGQLGQDFYLDQLVFRGHSSGFFVDVGAHDGVTYSNTLFLERNRGWSGLCLEPNPAHFPTLSTNRTSQVFQLAASDRNTSGDFVQISGAANMLSGIKTEYGFRHRRRIHREVRRNQDQVDSLKVELVRLDHLFKTEGIEHIDLLTVDTEGSEMAVLRGLGNYIHSVDHILLEKNYSGSGVDSYLSLHGFQKTLRIGWDYLFSRIPA